MRTIYVLRNLHLSLNIKQRIVGRNWKSLTLLNYSIINRTFGNFDMSFKKNFYDFITTLYILDFKLPLLDVHE